MKIPADPKSRQFLQLNRFRRERVSVHVYLLSGTRFTGRIRSFDVHTLLLETQQGLMVIYTHAISTIEQATAARARRPAGAPARRPEGADWRAADRHRSGESRHWNTPLEMPPATDPDVELPAGGLIRPVTPAAPTVTIVRRRSRLVPPGSGS